LAYLFRTQRNARIHALIAAAACGVGAWVGISRVEWAVIVFTIALVLILEGLNTAVEAAIDLASPKFHPLAKAAKDLAAGMVLIAALASIGVGLLILGPPLWAKLLH
jgi:diacylglycerol kinase